MTVGEVRAASGDRMSFNRPISPLRQTSDVQPFVYPVEIHSRYESPNR
jgi:hypothetical protein